LAWFVQKSHAQTMPSLRIVATQRRSGADLKVKPMLGRQALPKRYNILH